MFYTRSSLLALAVVLVITALALKVKVDLSRSQAAANHSGDVCFDGSGAHWSGDSPQSLQAYQRCKLAQMFSTSGHSILPGPQSCTDTYNETRVRKGSNQCCVFPMNGPTVDQNQYRQNLGTYYQCLSAGGGAKPDFNLPGTGFGTGLNWQLGIGTNLGGGTQPSPGSDFQTSGGATTTGTRLCVPEPNSAPDSGRYWCYNETCAGDYSGGMTPVSSADIDKTACKYDAGTNEYRCPQTLDCGGGGPLETFTPTPTRTPSPTPTPTPVITPAAASKINSFSPPAARLGNMITIRGSNFNAGACATGSKAPDRNATVLIGGKEMTADSFTATALRFKLSDLDPGAYRLQVVSGGCAARAGQVSDYSTRLLSVIENSSDPTIYSVVPPKLKTNQSYAVTVYGTNIGQVTGIIPESDGINVDDSSIVRDSLAGNKFRVKFNLSLASGLPQGPQYLNMEDESGNAIRFPIIISQ